MSQVSRNTSHVCTKSFKYLGNALDKFKMVGQLLKLKNQIDADTEAIQYSLTIEVADSGPAPALTTTLTIDVYVTGIDDNVPVWITPTNGAYTASNTIFLLAFSHPANQVYQNHLIHP